LDATPRAKPPEVGVIGGKLLSASEGASAPLKPPEAAVAKLGRAAVADSGAVDAGTLVPAPAALWVGNAA
jgi:hypothetical protein